MIFLLLRWLLELAFFLIYFIMIKVIPFCVVFGLPLFLVGILVGILGVSGHILFLVLIAFAIYKYYDIVIKSTFNISSSSKSGKKQSKIKSLLKSGIRDLNPFSKTKKN